jgi:hypothetical protein
MDLSAQKQPLSAATEFVTPTKPLQVAQLIALQRAPRIINAPLTLTALPMAAPATNVSIKSGGQRKAPVQKPDGYALESAILSANAKTELAP